VKNALIFFLLGAFTAIIGSRMLQPRPASPAAESEISFANKARGAVEDVTAQTRDTASRVKETVAGKLEDWHLTPDEIKADLAKTGEVVRTKAHAAGATIADARIVTVIKAKYVLDRDLSAIDIAVSADSGEVVLAGSVASPELIGRALQLALDTDGVRRVTSKLAVQTKAS